MLLVSLITAGIFSLIPGDPVIVLAGTGASPEQIEALRESLGLKAGVFERYLAWLKSVFSLRRIQSVQYGMPVTSLIGSRLAVTSTIALIASLLVLVISVPLGFFAAHKKNTWIDALISNGTVAALSVPNYLTGILIIWICGVTLRLFVPGQFVHYSENFFLYLRSLFFPALAVAVPAGAMLTKFIRASVWQEMHKDYTSTAKSKGASRARILIFHIAQNAAPPVLTLLGILVADILSGSIVIEQVFAIPGIGRLLIGSINARDFPVVITITMYTAFIVVIVNFVFEILSRLSDPRTGLE
jgi:ABC-type dipeptide/oligopeptide/nickel transport system permease component